MRLRLEQPLDLALTLQSGQAFRWRRLGEWWHGFIGESLVLLRQEGAGLEVASTTEGEQEISSRLRSYLRFDDNLPSIYRRLCRDDPLRSAVEKLYGLRLLRQEPWECLVGFLCSSHSNIPRISGIMERLAERFGDPRELEGIVRRTFPSPEQLAQAGEATLRGLGLGFRARYVAQTASVVAGGQLSLESLRDLPYEEAKQTLMALPGVGDKVADCVLLFSLDKLEAFPIDRWVRRSLEEWYQLTPQELGLPKERRAIPYGVLRAWAIQRFGPLAGYANQYLFYRRRQAGWRAQEESRA